MKARECYFHTSVGAVFALYANHNQTTLIVFLHGAGDSHLNFMDFLHNPVLANYDILMPDLMGYGKSERAALSFSFSQQVQALVEQITQLEKSYKNIILVPHSMAGIHAVLLAQGELNACIKGICAIETTVTQYGAFISEEISKQSQQNKDLSEWFEQWCHQIYQAGLSEPALKTYHAGLQLTTMRCFTDNCMEMRRLATAIDHAEFTHRMGHEFVKLTIPKLYCIAEKGHQFQSLPFLQANHVPVHVIISADSHFCAQQCPQAFLETLHHWTASIIAVA